MSISSAPASTAARTSASFTSSGAWPDGNAVATEATFTAEPASARRRRGRGSGRRRPPRPEGTDGIERVGRIAFALSARTLPGVSAPSSVVRSIIRIARSSAKSFDSRLIERFASSAGASLEGDGVDGAHAREATAARQLERPRSERLAHGRSLECARRAPPRRHEGRPDAATCRSSSSARSATCAASPRSATSARSTRAPS
jgi:hypothetical protein